MFCTECLIASKCAAFIIIFVFSSHSYPPSFLASLWSQGFVPSSPLPFKPWIITEYYYYWWFPHSSTSAAFRQILLTAHAVAPSGTEGGSQEMLGMYVLLLPGFEHPKFGPLGRCNRQLSLWSASVSGASSIILSCGVYPWLGTRASLWLFVCASFGQASVFLWNVLLQKIPHVSK